jgi:sialate O-acetylesterase
MFRNNMVLQRERPVPVWGRAQKGKTLTVSFAGQVKGTVVNENGFWILSLDPLEASSVNREMVIAYVLKENDTLKKNTDFTVTFENVLVGEVWFCAGQSNMEMGISVVENRMEELDDVNYPLIRCSLIAKDSNPFPVERIPSFWFECSRENVTTGGWNGFSAVALFFGKKIHKELNVPVGLIQAAFSGSRIDPWIPLEEMKDNPFYAEQYRDADEANKKYFEDKKNDKNARHPFANLKDYDQLKPATVYNAMVAPVVPFAIRGVLWYQGESNVGDGMKYADELSALIHGWRKAFGQGDFPFYYVQLPPWQYGVEGSLPALWEAQAACLSISNTAQAVTVDIGDPVDIHPKQKKPVGERLAFIALAKTYGRTTLVDSGPVFKSLKIDGNRAVISFDNIGSGLVSRDNKPLSWFTLAGSALIFYPAEAWIEGNTVVVRSNRVPNPAAVRFAWNNLASPNLGNREGLPARPFRTDK